MQLALLDCTVLSNFAHVRRPDLLRLALGSSASTTPEVMAELRRGQELGAVPSLDWRWLAILRPAEDEQKVAEALRRQVDPGEAECIAVAQARSGTLLSDDAAARRLARGRGLPVSGTIGVLLALVSESHISMKEGDQLLAIMVARGYRSPVASLGELLP
ncbi:MAG: DUF3368 domain-containing protein [Chloroflexi bacterium]|nr:DUF3368 domain-containing protein [Chloroflexota bacterium]